MAIDSSQERLISLKTAAAIFGYAPDHIGYLIRSGKILGKKLYSGKEWKISLNGINAYVELVNRRKAAGGGGGGGNIYKNLYAKTKKFFRREKFITLKEASDLSGYHSDYIGYLIRSGKVQGKKIYYGATWFTTEESIKNYLEEKRKKRKFVFIKPFSFLLKQGFYFCFRVPRYAAVFALSFLLFFSGVGVWVSASKNPFQTAEIYSLQTSGDWQGVENAKHGADVLPDGDIELFSEQNSAIYRGGDLEIVAENFQEVEINAVQLEENASSESETVSIKYLNDLFSKSAAKVKNFFANQIAKAQQSPSIENLKNGNEIISAKIKFSFGIGEKAPDLQILDNSQENTPETVPTDVQPVTFWQKIRSFFGKLVNRFSSIAKAQESSSTRSGQAGGEIFYFEDSGYSKTSTEGAVIGGQGQETSDQGQATTSTETPVPSAESAGTGQASDTGPSSAETSEGEQATSTEETTTTVLSEVTSTETIIESETTSTEIIVGQEATSSLPNPDTKIIIWYSVDGSAGSPQAWQKLDEITSYPLSNALNGGYFTYAAPFLKEWQDIENLKIKFEGVVGGQTVFTAFLDSVWVEVNYREKIAEEKEELELRPVKKDWKADEEPEFEIVEKNNPPITLVEKLAAAVSSVFGEKGKESKIKINTKVSGPENEEFWSDEKELTFGNEKESPKVKVSKTGGFRPGLHKISVSFEKDGNIYNLETDFSWGVLVINTNKSIYLSAEALAKEGSPQEKAYLQMGVLDELGKTICDADLVLEITAPDGKKTTLMTSPSAGSGPAAEKQETSEEEILEENPVTEEVATTTEESTTASETSDKEQEISGEEQVATTTEETTKTSKEDNISTTTEVSIPPVEAVSTTTEKTITETTEEIINPSTTSIPIVPQEDVLEPSDEGKPPELVPDNASQASIWDKVKNFFEPDYANAEDIVENTSGGTISRNPECGLNNLTNIPDYFAYYDVFSSGVYKIKLIAQTQNGIREIEDQFEARDWVPFDVERIGPTRIYPPATYEMKMKVKVNQDFDGEIIEKVPDSFGINTEGTQIKTQNNEQEIIWDVDWKNGETHELTYEFKAPNVSPYIFLLGELQFNEKKKTESIGATIFQEIRKWQLASDALATTTYSFANCSATGTDCVAWEQDLDSGTPASAGDYNSEAEALAADYTAIANSNNSRWAMIDPGSTDFDPIRVKMKINESTGVIQKITFTGEGCGSLAGTAYIHVCDLSANSLTLPRCNSWVQLGSGSVPACTTDGTVTGVLSTTTWSNYIDGSGFIYWHFWLDDNAEMMQIDFVKMEVNYTAPITVSGYAYDNDGTTAWQGCNGGNVAIYSNGSVATTTCSAATGYFTSSNITAPSATGSPIIIWFNNTSTYGSAVTRYAGSGNVTTTVRKDSVTVTHQDSGPITVADMAVYNNDSDSDINYSTSSGLTVEAGSKLIINGTSTFTPGATVTVASSTNGDLYVMPGSTLNGTSSIYVYGGDATGTGTINLTGGTFLLSGTSTGYFGSNASWNFYNLTFGSGSAGTTTASGSGTTTIARVLTIAPNHVLNAGEKTWQLLGGGATNPFVRSGTFNSQTSTLDYYLSANAEVTAADYYNLKVRASGAEGEFECGDNVTFNYRGKLVTYGTVNSTGSECWMDRNLGATSTATAYNDSNGYGDLFQWGRLDDGHQSRTSATTSATTSQDVPGHNMFIVVPDVTPWDWHIPQKDSLWASSTHLNDPCPAGWRVPTYQEWSNEESSWPQQNYNGAFASPLKLTAGGNRIYNPGSLLSVGSYGFYWSSTDYGVSAYNLRFYISDSVMTNLGRAYGFSVRCLKD